MKWTDPRVDWKNRDVVDLWEYRGGDDCVGCGQSRDLPHQNGCDRERCIGCGEQMIMCLCEQTEVCMQEELIKKIFKDPKKTLNKILDDYEQKFSGGPGIAYVRWFDGKCDIKWTKFSEEYPKCEWVWISDYSNVFLQHATNLHNLKHDKTVWAKAEIVCPPAPKNPVKMHECSSSNSDIHCVEDQSNGFLYCFSGPHKVRVQFCPFCGYKGKKDAE